MLVKLKRCWKNDLCARGFGMPKPLGNTILVKRDVGKMMCVKSTWKKRYCKTIMVKKILKITGSIDLGNRL